MDVAFVEIASFLAMTRVNKLLLLTQFSFQIFINSS
jgi:hypothetical protein